MRKAWYFIQNTFKMMISSNISKYNWIKEQALPTGDSKECHNLKEVDTPGTISIIFQGRQVLLFPVYFLAHQVPSEKGCTLKGKNLL